MMRHKNKKVSSVITATLFVVLFILTGCGGGDNAKVESSEAEPATVAETATESETAGEAEAEEGYASPPAEDGGYVEPPSPESGKTMFPEVIPEVTAYKGHERIRFIKAKDVPIPTWDVVEIREAEEIEGFGYRINPAIEFLGEMLSPGDEVTIYYYMETDPGEPFIYGFEW